MRYYVGTTRMGGKRIFKSNVTPTKATHGEEYCSMVGPFRTKRAATFYIAFGHTMP